jgi:hypothetical protein
MKLFLQSDLLKIFQTWFPVNNSKSYSVFVLLHQSLIVFLQIHYTGNFVCTTTTYSESTEDWSSRERYILWVFKNPPTFKPSAKNSTGGSLRATDSPFRELCPLQQKNYLLWLHCDGMNCELDFPCDRRFFNVHPLEWKWLCPFFEI